MEEKRKLGILLSLIGGGKKEETVRGKIHVLLIGEPATGKTQLLKFAHKLSNKAIWTTGMGCSSAGLTVTACKVNFEWVFEASALVLADGGICCIDDFHLMKKDDRNAIHEAMEQQTVSLAKAGMICHLNTRATILAATSISKGLKYDFNKDLEVNTGLSSSLLSRYDLIFIMTHKYDSALLLEILQTHKEGVTNLWGLRKLKHYIAAAQNKSPTLSTEAQNIFTKYFSYIRENEFVHKDRKTVRFLEGIIRLGHAHARLMYRDEVTLFDAVMIYLMEFTLKTGMFQTEEWIDSMEGYILIEEMCLKQLKTSAKALKKKSMSP